MKLRGALCKVQVFFLCLFILFSSLSPVAVYASQNSERETIRVGFFAFDGYHMIDENGIRSGYGYDFLRLAARYINVDYEYIGYESGWNDMLDMLKDGEIDMVTSAQVTPERLKDFAFSKSIGSSSAMLTTSSENNTIVAGDYSTYHGIRIGLLRDNSRNKDLERFAKENDFSYTAAYFQDSSVLEEALQSGQVDAILTSSLRKTECEQILDLFSTHDFYVIVRKDNAKLLNKINYAIDQLNAVEGDWQNDLTNLYYEHADEKNLSFTPQEQALIQEYIDGQKTLIVSVCTDKKPYAYTENGKAKGILIDYFAQIADHIGIPYTVIAPKDREEYLIWCNEENQANVFLDGRFAYIQQAEEMKKAISTPYTTMRLAMVTRRDFNGEIRTLAVSTAQGPFGIEDGLAPNAKRLSVDSREEAMRAVMNGKADATFVYLYTAQQFVNQDERGILTYTMLEEPTFDYHIAFAASVDRTLSGIFTKAIYAMPAGAFENIASQYTSYKAEDVDFITWAKIHPIPTLGIGAVILFMCLLLILVFQRQKAVKLEQKRSAQLRELALMADSSNRAKTVFLNSISHDIRTPMNAITGFASLAVSHLDEPQRVKDYLQKISIASEHLLSLINDVLDMSRIESGKVKINEQPLYLPDLLNEIRTIMQPTVASKRLDFIIDTADVKDENIFADKLRLNQILLNILSNGVKFNKTGGMISLQIRQLDQAPAGHVSYEFIVRDTGIGMKQEFAEHIFEAFAREETATVSGIPGTGLGMTITQSLVDIMGGSIQVKSQEGVGTEFTISLTFRLNDKPIICEKTKPHSLELSNKKILLVEDNPLNQEIAATVLEEMGLLVDTADDGSIAVQKIRNASLGQYDLILMDIQMPIMDGYEATKQIRRLPNEALAHIPIIAITANAFSSDQEKAIACGMNGYLTKPLDIPKMTEVLNEFLNT